MSESTQEMLRQKWPIALLIIAIAIDLWLGQVFFTPLVTYGLFIRFLSQNDLKKEKRQVIAVALWIAVTIVGISTFYVNNYMPHGPFYPSGDEVCQGDGRSCTEGYVEDMQNLDIPEWAKFLRHYGVGLVFALAVAGMLAGSREKDNEDA